MDQHKMITGYIVGLVLSLLLTIGAYLIVVNPIENRIIVISLVLFFAVVQMVVQLVFFLHLGDESKPRWRRLSAIYAGLIVLIVVVGSVWIMNNLNYSLTSEEVEEYIFDEERINPVDR